MVHTTASTAAWTCCRFLSCTPALSLLHHHMDCSNNPAVFFVVEDSRCNYLSCTLEGTSCHASDSVQFSSVAQSCPTRCNPMNHSMPGLPVHHQLPEFTQTHVHRVSDAIQPSHPLSSPSPPAPNPSQHQSLFQ